MESEALFLIGEPVISDILNEVYTMKSHPYFGLMTGLFFLFTTAALPAQTEDTLSGKIHLFGDDSAPPVYLESSRDWIPIAAFDFEAAGLPHRPEGGQRRWRLETRYEHTPASGPVTLQIRLRGAEGDPVFTHPWSEGADRLAEAYSNWYIDTEELMNGSDRGYVEARLIAPPRTPLSGRLYSVSIEAWDRVETVKSKRPAGPEVQLAYARPLPSRASSPVGRADHDAVDPNLSSDAALSFALGFVEACLSGDLPTYYRSQNDPVRSLDDGRAMPRYRLNPPASIPGLGSLDDYRRRFDYSIHPASDLKELFPEWFDPDRPWTPDEDAFLFLGHHDRLGGSLPDEVDYLVFLIEPDGDGGWKVAARPGS